MFTDELLNACKRRRRVEDELFGKAFVEFIDEFRVGLLENTDYLEESEDGLGSGLEVVSP